MSFRHATVALFACAAMTLGLVASAQQPAPKPVASANFKQASRYSDAFLKGFTYSTSVEPQWIGKTDVFWYEYRTSKGKQWYKVHPSQLKKQPLFDRPTLAAQLSEQVRKPLDPLQLPLALAKMNDEGTKLKFVTDGLQFEYDLATEKLAKLGKAQTAPTGFGAMSEDQKQKMRELLGEERFKELLDQQKKDEGKKKDDESWGDGTLTEEEAFLIQQELALSRDAQRSAEDDDPLQQKKGTGKGGGKGGGFNPNDYRNFSPDKTVYAFVKNHNLYVAEAGKEDQAIQLTKDGTDDYSFTGGGFGFGGQQFQQKEQDKDKQDLKDLKDGEEKKIETKQGKNDPNRKTRAPVTWSKDSKAFYVLRRDWRGIKELFLVNNIAEPRPTLMKYLYPMPGDENVRKSELYVYHRDKSSILTKIDRKWKDESYGDLHWGKSSADLRFLRTDRMVRNIEFCTHDIAKNESKCLIVEGFENSNITPKPMKYLDDSDEMIWWSERSGWGHFYLYDRAGKLKNAITSGNFRASTIVAIDTKHRILYFRGNSRELDENVYWEHLYCAHFDGTGLTLLDQGAAHHDSRLSPTKQFIVDNYSRADTRPIALREARGKQVMDLEEADLSKLHEVGWKMPETFIAKAADGVTDLYGNLYKPFDFDPSKKYPVIAHVYPGPQTESMAHSFKAYTSQQQLAQLGFIVIQVGNRGGSPLRSKAYQSFSYGNLRDYGLADKKFVIEQLAAQHAWMDIERVGIYGHSGGGFMSAAALLVKPYNDFFKVAVASAGNHDNNVYNNTWSERYHGMKEVPVGAKEEPKKSPFKGKGKIVMPLADEEQTKDDKKDEGKKEEPKKDDKKDDIKPATRFEIKIPTNGELAANLKGKLLLVHGDMDNNVHPANTIRLADALIKANKRFDMLILPGRAHAFGPYQPYFTQRMWEYFAEHLLDDRPSGADLYDRKR